jgi:multiple sugar transport system permease protein
MSSITAKAGAVTPSAPARRRSKIDRGHWVGLLYIAPAIVLVTVFFVIPLCMTVWMSLHNWPLMGQHRFIGLDNYVAITKDVRFWNALKFTLYYTVIVTIAIFAVAFPLALFVEKPRPMTGVYRTAFFMPVVVGFASASLLWAWLLNVDSGLFSPAAQQLGLTEKKFNLLATFNPAFWSIIVMVVWKVAGFTMVILMTGLQSIPTELQEAAKIDGANAWQRFRAITLPLMRRTVALALILSVAGSILAFDQFYILLRGGPRNSTITAVYWIFNQSFVSFKLGYGAALSMVLLVILVVLSLIQLRLLRNPEGT